MKKIKTENHPDVVLIYQDRDDVESAIQQILSLNLKFKAYPFSKKTLHTITEMQPKVLLLSSNNIKVTISQYIDYLEDFSVNIAPHSSILLIHNKEMANAFLACENGLCDNYAVINPLNDPFRLKLVLLQELKLIESNLNYNIEELVGEGEEEFASCIEHGVILKKSFLHEVKQCQGDIKLATDRVIENEEAKEILQNLVGISIDKMNENVTKNIQHLLDQLDVVKANHQALQQSVEKEQNHKPKTLVGVNTDILTNIDDHDDCQTASYKILIAEPSSLFANVIEEIFIDTAYKYIIVNNGNDALTQIRSFNPDVAILSYDLPEITGLEITKMIRKEKNHMPVIAYTHHRDKEVIKHWIPLGLQGYLIKPSKKSHILKMVNEAVKNPVKHIAQQNPKHPKNIEWLPEYSVGNAELDEQHKMLFTMVNEFSQEKEKGPAIVAFHNLVTYIDLHFDAEENLLRQLNYPKTEEHTQQHNELRKRFEQIQKRLEHYDTDLQFKIAIFLRNWLTNHLISDDMEYKKYAIAIEEESFSI